MTKSQPRSRPTVSLVIPSCRVCCSGLATVGANTPTSWPSANTVHFARLLRSGFVRLPCPRILICPHRKSEHESDFGVMRLLEPAQVPGCITRGKFRDAAEARIARRLLSNPGQEVELCFISKLIYTGLDGTKGG